MHTLPFSDVDESVFSHNSVNGKKGNYYHVLQLPVPKFKKGLGTSVHIVKITSCQKNNPTTRNIS